MSRLHEMKSKGLDKVYAVYSRSGLLSSSKTMADVLDGIKERGAASVSTREHTSKSKVKTFKATMKV